MCSSKDPVFMQILLTQREKGKGLQAVAPGKGPQGRTARPSLQAVHIGVDALLKAEGLNSPGDLLQSQQLSV